VSQTGKTVMNLLFPLFAALGAAAVYYVEEIPHELNFLAPTALTALYAVFIALGVSRSDEREFASHQIDSIYFLGFLYTLISLAVLFYQLSRSGLEGESALFGTIYYAGISVTTSVGGVLFRSMAMGSYLRNHSEDGGDIEKSYELLKSIADGFSSSYSETFTMIQLYLDERVRTAAAVDGKEQEYLKALEGFIVAVTGFTDGLTEAREALAESSSGFARSLCAQEDPVRAMGESALAFSRSAGRMRAELDALPLEQVNSGLEGLRKETGDLDTVLDSLIEVLERKVEKIPG
jgi:hypothetical protein